MSDPFDPNLLDLSPPERRIYGDNNAQTWHVVDEEDYWYFSRWRWTPKFSHWGDKYYLRRAVSIHEDGRRVRTITLYLHIEIMRRTGIKQPTPAHCIVDHRDGDTTLCRRGNLRWATHRLNSLNRHGSHYYGELPLDSMLSQLGDGR